MFFESIKIMFLGMGTVFLFLTIMVYMTKLMSYLIMRTTSQSKKSVQSTTPASVSVPKPSNENAKIAAILGAMQHHHELEREGKI